MPYTSHFTDALHHTFLLIFTEQDFSQAITFYSEAIDVNPTIAAYYGNRSFAYLKTECFGYALTDASKALELDRTYVKVSFKIFYMHIR